MTPELSILVCSLRSRRPTLHQLLAALRRSAAGLPVEVLVEVDDGEAPSGAKRNRLTAAARGRYLAFVDDDDLVSDDYCPRLLEQMAVGRPDVVTFQLEYHDLGRGATRLWEFAAGGDHRRVGDRTLMTPNHLCAWRADLARLVPWVPTIGYMDDVFWYRALWATGRVLTAAHVARPLYRYFYSPPATVNQRPERIAQSLAWARRGGVECFWYQGDDGAERVAIGLAGPHLTRHQPTLPCVIAGGREARFPRARLRHYHTIKV